jgi:hypothetical protein
MAVDVGISRAKDRRPGLDLLIADAHKRKFEVIVVWKFDRFARSVSHLLRALETFRALGVEFVSLSEQVDRVSITGLGIPKLARFSRLKASALNCKLDRSAGIFHSVPQENVLARTPAGN